VNYLSEAQVANLKIVNADLKEKLALSTLEIEKYKRVCEAIRREPAAQGFVDMYLKLYGVSNYL
jgi:hypothetical protein